MEKTGYRTKPRRKARHEAIVLAAVAALPAALAAVFPYKAALTRPAGPDRASGAAHCAFVELGEKAAAEALSKVRTVLSRRSAPERALMADLTRPTFGETPLPPAADADDRLPPPAMPRLSAGFAPLPPSLAAPALPAAEEDETAPEPPPAFSREELLKIE